MSCHSNLCLAGVAQLARARPCQGRGRRFEPHHPLQFFPGGPMKQMTITLIAALTATFSFASPFEAETQECVIEQLELQYPQLATIDNQVGAVIGSDDINFEMLIVQTFEDGGFGQIAVKVTDADYMNAELLVEGLKTQPLDISSCF
jgi:hypothetical protein